MPIYPKVFNLMMRFSDSNAGKAGALIVSLGLTIAAAYVLYRLVEQPAQRWSSSFKYRSYLARG